MVEPDPVGQIEAAILTLLRRANDPRGNQQINDLAGTDIERAGAVMLARIELLQPARLSDLAEAAGVEMSTASRQVAKLVERGFVVRVPDPLDGRASLHSLSPSGVELRSRLKKAVRTWFEMALEGFDANERSDLAGLLDRFVASVAGSGN